MSYYKNKVHKYQKPLSGRNMYLDIAPVFLMGIFQKSSKQQLVYHGRQLRALLLAQQGLSSNKRHALIKLLRYCKKLYYGG